MSDSMYKVIELIGSSTEFVGAGCQICGRGSS